MSWYTDLIQSAGEYVNAKVSFFSGSHKTTRAAHLYTLQCLPVPAEGQVPECYNTDDVPPLQKAQIVESLNLLNSFPVYARAMEIESEAALLFGNEADKPTNHWSIKNQEYRNLLLQAARNIAQLPIPGIPEKPKLPQPPVMPPTPKASRKDSAESYRQYDLLVAEYERQCEEAHEKYRREIAGYSEQYKIWNKQSDDQGFMVCFKRDTQRNLNAAYHCAMILDLVKQFETFVYTGKTIKAKEILQKINAHLDDENVKQHLHYGFATGSVLAKLIQVQSRVNSQFSPNKYDEPNAPLRITNIIEKFKTRIIDTINHKYSGVNLVNNEIPYSDDDQERKNRLDTLQRVVQADIEKTDIAEYRPWWGARAWRAIKSIFTTSSNYLNEKPKHHAWSISLSRIINAVIPAFLKSGTEGVEQTKRDNLGLKPRPNNDLGVEREINSELAKYANKVNTLLDTNANANKFVSRCHINTQETADIVKDVTTHFLKSPFITKDTCEDLMAPSSLNTLLNDELVAFPQWPSETLSARSSKNIDWMKAYAEQVGKCINQVIKYGTYKNLDDLQKCLSEFILPAVFRLNDIFKIRSVYMREPENCIGLYFYKHLFKEIFAFDNNQLPHSIDFILQPDNPAEPADVRNFKLTWKHLCEFKKYLDLYDVETKQFGMRNADNTFMDINAETGEHISAFAKEFVGQYWVEKKLPESVDVNGVKVNLKNFYFELTNLRQLLRRSIVRVPNQKIDISDDEKRVIQAQIKKLQEESYLGNTPKIDSVPAILKGKIYDEGRNEIKVDPKVRLLAALNALANHFNQFPSYSEQHTYSAFFDPGADCINCHSKCRHICTFIVENGLKDIRPINDIYNKLLEWKGTNIQNLAAILTAQPSPARVDVPPSNGGSKKNSPPQLGVTSPASGSGKEAVKSTPEKETGFFSKIFGT